MRYKEREVGLGGGEGSVIYYSFQIGQVDIPLATSRAIKFSKVKKKWVKELEFLDDFCSFDDLKDILNECEDTRLLDYFESEIVTYKKGGSG